MRPVRLNLIGLGALIGVGLGLLYGLVISPVQIANTVPADLRSDYQEQYILMTAAAFHSDGNLERAQIRLGALGIASPADTVTALAQRAAAQQRDETHVAWLGELAFALGVALEPVTPVPTPEALVAGGDAPTETTAAVTPPETGAPPPPTATIIPTPTATPVFDYSVVSIEPVCDTPADPPQLQVEIVDALGEPLPGVLVIVRWPTGEDRFYTGLKPEISRGYGDFDMQAGETYSLQVGSRTPPVTDLTAPECTSETGETFNGSMLIRLQRGA